MAAIGNRINEIFEMLLPEGYLPIQPRANPASPTNEGQTQPTTTATESTNSGSPILADAPPRPPSWMMGPACALRILAQNSKYYPPSYGDVETDVMMYCLRGAAGPYARDDAIRQFEASVSVRNTRRREGHVAVARQDSEPK